MMKCCEECVHHSIVTRYDPTDHDRAYDLARCDLTGEETDGEMWSCDEWEGEPRTVEDVLARFLTSCGDDDPHHYDEQIAEYADELRELMEVGE